MSITINEIIKSVFRAIERQGISLSQSKYSLIEKEANKIIHDLIEMNEKEKKFYAKFLVTIPCNIDRASLRNRTVREFITTINPSVEMEFELVKKTLTLLDSYDVFDGKISNFPCHMSVNRKNKQYSYSYEES